MLVGLGGAYLNWWQLLNEHVIAVSAHVQTTSVIMGCHITQGVILTLKLNLFLTSS